MDEKVKSDPVEKQEDYIKMDYSIKEPQGRIEKVKEIIASTPSNKLTSYYLTKMADYLIDGTLTKEEKKKKKILTQNHMVTVGKRELSFEGLVSRLENGEDGIYNMIREDKNIIFSPKSDITEEDIQAIPELKSLREAIEVVKASYERARGKKRGKLWRQLREMRQDQYVIRSAYKKPIYSMNLIKSISRLDLEDDITINEETLEPENKCIINFFNPDHVGAVLRFYSKIKEDTWSSFNSDMKWWLWDLEDIIDKYVKEKNPAAYDVIVYKIDGLSNDEIREEIYNNHGVKYSPEYISALWRKKIPQIVADGFKQEYIIWHWQHHPELLWKTCSRCGKRKPAHKYFYTKNKSAALGFYSQCKTCRSEKYHEAKKKG